MFRSDNHEQTIHVQDQHEGIIQLSKEERIDFLLNINKAMEGEAITLKEETLH